MRHRAWALLALFIADRYIKNGMWFTPPQGRWSFVFHPVLNADIAFSLPVPQGFHSILTALLIIITISIASYSYARYRGGHADYFLWALIGIGSLSNILDRLQLGGVLDYIDLHFWPIFNLSDVYISIGVVGLLTVEFISRRKKNA